MGLPVKHIEKINGHGHILSLLGALQLVFLINSPHKVISKGFINYFK